MNMTIWSSRKERLDVIALTTMEVDCAGMAVIARAIPVRLDACSYERKAMDYFSEAQPWPGDVPQNRLPCSGGKILGFTI